MNKYIVFALIGASLLASCARRIQGPDEVVGETYIHRYGVAIEKEDWASNGESGQVKTTMKNGVVVTKSYLTGEQEGDTTYTYPHSDLIEKKETYSQGKLKSEITYYRSGSQKEQVIYGNGSTRQVYGWYDGGAPRSSENYEDTKLVKGEYFNLTHQPDSRVDNANGARTRRDPFGHLIGIDTVQDGVIVLSKTYYPNGAVQQEIPYVNGQINGSLKSYLPDGQPSSIETWTLGEKTGTTLIFENGEKIAEIPYIRGVKEGIEKRYRGGSAVVEEISWVSDSRHGPSKTMIGDVKKTDFYYQGKLVSQSVFEKMTNGITPHQTY